MLIFAQMAGIYIHIPFCKQKCSYCDFHFSTTFQSYRQEMIDSIVKEIEIRKEYLLDQQIETIYFGGGTPSLLTSDELKIIFQKIKSLFDISKTLEITLEANPDDISIESLDRWKSIGINRLSIGLQSFREEDLKWMNRAHTSEESLNCVALAKEKGFDNISIDLIYGLPNFTLEDWKKNIQTVIDFGIPHISAYCLTVEDKTALSKWVKDHKIITANEDQQSEQFEYLISELERNGIHQYEISNFSTLNFESKHNSNYWKGKHYLGIGPSAHSFNGTSRSWNISNNRKYIQLIQDNQPTFETEILSIADQFNELLLIGLRTVIGVNLEQLKTIQTPSEKFWKKVNKMESDAWLILTDTHIVLTKEGRLKADYIASELFI
jgi:oxygen-independent coproporphyrinogen-3 oxidase